MANQADTKKALTTPVAEKPKTLRDLVGTAAKELGRALPAHMNPERVVRIAQTCITLNPELAKCTPASFMGSLFVLAQLGLEPIAGRAYLLPFNNKRKIGDQWQSVKEVQAVIGYKGYIDLFYRHDSSLMIDMQTVYAKDDFEYEYGTKAFLRHRPANGDRGEAVAFYALANLKGGAQLFRVMSRDECLEHGRKHSKTYDADKGEFGSKSPWRNEEGPMCMKTVLLQLGKVLPLSVELQRAISVDETSRDFREGIGDAMALPPTTDWSVPAIEAQTTTLTATDINAAVDTAITGPSTDAEIFAGMKTKLGKKMYYEIMGSHGFEHSTQIPDAKTKKAILAEMEEFLTPQEAK